MSEDLSSDTAGIPQSLPHDMTQTVPSAIDVLGSQPFLVSSCMKAREKIVMENKSLLVEKLYDIVRSVK